MWSGQRRSSRTFWATSPFEDEASKTNAVALLLTPILRPAIDGPILWGTNIRSDERGCAYARLSDPTIGGSAPVVPVPIGGRCEVRLSFRAPQHLRRIVRDYVAFYNADRPHRFLDLEPPAGPRPSSQHAAIESSQNSYWAASITSIGGSRDARSSFRAPQRTSRWASSAGSSSRDGGHSSTRCRRHRSRGRGNTSPSASRCPEI